MFIKRCSMSVLRLVMQGAVFAPVRHAHFTWRLRADYQGDVIELSGFRGEPYKFTESENAENWLKDAIAKASRGNLTSQKHFDRLLKIQVETLADYLSVEMRDSLERNQGIWSVTMPNQNFTQKKIDGGFANSVYLTNQTLDGGASNG